MANIPGATNVNPGIFTDVVTESRGTAVAGGLRVAAIMGEGSTTKTLVSAAFGNGKDGLNSSYSSASGADGRHFLVGIYPLVSNRTTLYKNGVPLKGVEENIPVKDAGSFSNVYDYRLDISNGRIELQKSYLQDLGGSLWTAGTTNKGDGYLSGVDNTVALLDSNAPQETWTIRCADVQRDSFGNPLPGTAKFIAIGSVSGNKTDANGKPVYWFSDGSSNDNGILQFSVNQSTLPGAPVLDRGDYFTVKVKSGILSANDSLVVTYIPESYINDPVQLQGLDDVIKRFGVPSLENNLSLGAQLAFSNQASSVYALQTKPSMPRRTDFILSEKVNRYNPDPEDEFVFPLDFGFTPDPNSAIHFFITDPATGVETQVLPNQYEYYTLNTPGYLTLSQFINSTYNYTLIDSSIISDQATIKSGEDGTLERDESYVDGDYGIFSLDGYTFTSGFTNLNMRVFDSSNTANNSDKYTIYKVEDGKLYVQYIPQSFVEELTGNLNYKVIDPVTMLEVPGFSGSDGAVTTDGVFTSSTASVTFDSSVIGKRLLITDETSDNHGYFDIVDTNPLLLLPGNSIQLKRSIVNESNIKYWVIDTSVASQYIVVSKDVVPDGYALRATVINYKDADFYDAGWVQALEALEKINVDIVVPLPKQTISVIFQNALQHCLTMSNIRNKKERVLFIGAINGLMPENLVGTLAEGTVKLAAVEDIGILEGIQGYDVNGVLEANPEDLTNYSVPDAFGGTYRCVYFYPDQIIVQAGTDNVPVDGFYIAAAAAGYVSAQTRIEMPLTNKVLSGFTILRDKLLTTSQLESLSYSGVCVLQPVAGGGKVVWGVTTSQSGFAEEQEISIIFIRDRIAKVLRNSFAGYIGLPETPTTQLDLSAQAVNTLNSFINQGLITKYANLVVQRDTTDPRQWNIYVKVQPVYPVNWIYIRVGVGTI